MAATPTTIILSRQLLTNSYIRSKLPDGLKEDQLTPLTTNDEVSKYHPRIKLNKDSKKPIPSSATWTFKCENGICKDKWDPRKTVMLASNLKRHAGNNHNLKDGDECSFLVFSRFQTSITNRSYEKEFINLTPIYDESNQYIGAKYIESKQNDHQQVDEDSNYNNNNHNVDNSEANNESEDGDSVNEILDANNNFQVDNENDVRSDDTDPILQEIKVNDSVLSDHSDDMNDESGESDGEDKRFESDINVINAADFGELVREMNSLSSIGQILTILDNVSRKVNDLWSVFKQKQGFINFKPISKSNDSAKNDSNAVTTIALNAIKNQDSVMKPFVDPIYDSLETCVEIANNAKEWQNLRHQHFVIQSDNFEQFLKQEGKDKFKCRKKYGDSDNSKCVVYCKSCHWAVAIAGMKDTNKGNLSNYTTGIEVTRAELQDVDFFKSKIKGLLHHLKKLPKHYNFETRYLRMRRGELAGMLFRADIIIHMSIYAGSKERFEDILALFYNNKRRAACDCKDCCPVGQKLQSKRIADRLRDILDLYLSIQVHHNVINTNISHNIVFISASVDGVDQASDKFTISGLIYIDNDCMKCLFLNLDQFEYDKENPRKTCEAYIDSIVKGLDQVNLKPKQSYTRDELFDPDVKCILFCNVSVDGALLAKIDDENACPMIDTHCTNKIQDSPFREAAIHDRQHRKQLSLADAINDTFIEKQKILTQSIAKSLKEPKNYNWGNNLQTTRYSNDRQYYFYQSKYSCLDRPEIVFVDPLPNPKPVLPS